MNSLQVLGKYLDQPRVVNKFSKTVPAILIGGGGIYGVYHVAKVPKKNRKNEMIKTASVITLTVISALMAPKIAAKLVKSHEHEHEFNENEVKNLIDKFVKNNKISDDIKPILNDAKTKRLKWKQIKTLFEGLKDNPKAKEFLSGDEGLIPDPENVDSKHILGEIGKFSIIGGVSVLGGILGGILGDKLTDKNWKSKVPDKIKEGAYQFLANIFLCNIGAGVALGIMEKAKVKNKGVRAAGMIAGILLTGVIFGSAMANVIGNKIINPILGKKNKEKLYDERTPELLDISLHIDDVATVGVLSGLKWIEPALPVLYSVSGYRAGIGYRNGKPAN